MRRRSVVLAVAAVAGALLVASLAVAAGGKKHLKAGDLIGYEENPDVSTAATGSFKVTIDDAAQTLAYELSYSGLEGSVTQAHIHFGKPAVTGGITLFLCGTAASPGPAGTPTCPADGTVSRTATAADIIGPTGQGIEPGSFAELAAALRAGATYANVHSTKWPGGEIRAQINER
jgi:hypothetical protein